MDRVALKVRAKISEESLEVFVDQVAIKREPSGEQEIEAGESWPPSASVCGATIVFSIV